LGFCKTPRTIGSVRNDPPPTKTTFMSSFLF
jgi:hypothetical protein